MGTGLTLHVPPPGIKISLPTVPNSFPAQHYHIDDDDDEDEWLIIDESRPRSTVLTPKKRKKRRSRTLATWQLRLTYEVEYRFHCRRPF